MTPHVLLALGLALSVMAWVMERTTTDRWAAVAGFATGLLLMSAVVEVMDR